MKIGISKCGKHDLVYIGYILILIKYTMASTCQDLPNIFNVGLVILAIGCFAFHILLSRYSKKQLIAILGLVFLAILIYISSGDDDIIILSLFAITLREIDVKKLVKIYCFITISIMIYTVVYSLITQTNIGVYEQFRVNVGYEYRYTFGFRHPNTLHSVYVRIIAGLLILDTVADKKNSIKYIILGVINLILYNYSDSRTGMIVVFAILFVAILFNIATRFLTKKIFLSLSKIMSVFVVGFVVFAIYNYSKYAFLVKIDSMITGRFLFGNRFLQKANVGIFGTDIRELTSEMVLDSGIISVWFKYGIIFFIMVLLIYLIGINVLWSKQKYIGVVVVVFMIVYAIMENMYANIFTNIGFTICCFYTFEWIRKVRLKIKSFEKSQ